MLYICGVKTNKQEVMAKIQMQKSHLRALQKDRKSNTMESLESHYNRDIKKTKEAISWWQDNLLIAE